MADKYNCRKCHKNVAATGQSPSPLRYRKHDGEKTVECENSRTIIPGWMVKRGPETVEDDRPVIGRDYAQCPDCGRSPLLDDAGKFAPHIREAGVPSAERVDCPMSGEPYTPEGEECETEAPSGPPSPKEAPGTAAPPQTAATDGSATTERSPRTAVAPTEAEQMLNRWAAKTREIEDRKLPETEPSPASTPTQPDLPPRPDAPEVPPSSPSPAAPNPTGADSAAGAGAEASKEMEPSVSAAASPDPVSSASPASAGPSEAPAQPLPESAPTPASTSTDSAAPAPAAAPAPDAASTPTAPAPEEPAAAVPAESPFSQPGLPFSQPARLPAAVTDPIPMTVLAEQVVARMKELFYAYDNRNTDDNRSAQVTLGPSEIGTPCDRRLAMSLLGIPAVNPGGDGWAAFVGTCVHAGLAEMFMWADAGTGRFAVEQRLTFPNEHVPKGTADLLDRTLCMVDDHKAQGRWSLDKLKTQGIPPGYRVQLHTYGYGQRLKGEVVDFVALISWPREASTLADMYAVIEPYDPQVARDAFARVDRLAAEVQAHETERATWAGLDIAAQKLSIARQFSVADDCRFCPFYAPGDPGMTRGCNGRS
ncbi:hypothetical protein [Streptomyces sp. NBC_00687]|uniref:hypothetical protein n=1 Tax=Streptomyces sp. NBC_00687 TaxID=2975807 RepID=UPI00224D6A59|nr:hypothetical protein [Streptomyces sp. NBC_00687]MCX4912875.1 hypothetical protein [Streptomyces sp. NBC_00687]